MLTCFTIFTGGPYVGPTTRHLTTAMDIDYNMPVGNIQTYYERKLSKFLIMFDNSNLLYFPGQFLSGRVIVELQDEMAITGNVFHSF